MGAKCTNCVNQPENNDTEFDFTTPLKLKKRPTINNFKKGK